jgi:hypothetical protein
METSPAPRPAVNLSTGLYYQLVYTLTDLLLAAQCIAARAHAEDLLRSLRQYAGDIGLVIRLNAQYASMVRTSLSVHGCLMRVQALRHKREAVDGAATADA